MQARGGGASAPSQLGNLLRRHREPRGLLQEEVAALVDPPLSVNTIGNVERGRTRPHRHTLDLLMEALGLDAGQRAELTAAWRAFALVQPRSACPESGDPDLLTPISPARTLHNLPEPATALIGREHELGVITTQLRSRAVVLLTLTGAGGIGKSRLAVHAAATLLDDFADGVWFVPLARISHSDQVIAAIAQSLGLPDAGGALRENVREFLARRHLLLVLDNFEHLLPAARLVAELVEESSGLKVLVTSRELLHLSTEHTLEVPPLRLAPRALPAGSEMLSQCDAVQLFVERARAVEPDFALTTTSALLTSFLFSSSCLNSSA
jgi:transcriptional regulator with XRE-family HTH domain